MRKIIVISMISIDGVMQAPGGSKEDTADGFKYGGWVAPHVDEQSSRITREELKQTDYLLGRKTFEIWEPYWPQHADFWPGINEGAKYVLSGTRDSSPWKNTTFIKTVADIKKLKSENGPDIQVWGSSELIHLLLENDLVDVLRIKTYPVILGKGKKLFDNNSMPATYTLTESHITSKGVIIANYKRAGEVTTGNLG